MKRNQTINEIIEALVKLRDKAGWKKIRNPKHIAFNIAHSANELLEFFQWKNPKELKESLKHQKNMIADKLLQVVNSIFLLGGDFKIDIEKRLKEKIEKEDLGLPEPEKKEPVKYTEIN